MLRCLAQGAEWARPGARPAALSSIRRCIARDREVDLAMAPLFRRYPPSPSFTANDSRMPLAPGQAANAALSTQPVSTCSNHGPTSLAVRYRPAKRSG